MKKIIIIILLSSCIKGLNNLNMNYKGINDDLIVGCEEGDINKVTILLSQGADINFGSFDGNIALIEASSNGHKEAVELLIERGANVNDKSKIGLTSLIWASQEGHKEVVELLLNKGADINDKDNKGETALMYASENGHKEVVELLINKGANINDNDKNKKGSTALIFAIKEHRFSVVKLLIEKGADINCVNSSEESALDISVKYRNEKIMDLLLFSFYTLAYNSYQDIGSTKVLDNAIRRGDIREIIYILEKNKDDIKRYGVMPLIIAILKGNTEIIELLIKKVIEINDEDKYDNSPLMYAASRGNIKTAEMLLNKMKIRDIKDTQYEKAFKLAKEKGHNEILRLLEKFKESVQSKIRRNENKEDNNYNIVK